MPAYHDGLWSRDVMFHIQCFAKDERGTPVLAVEDIYFLRLKLRRKYGLRRPTISREKLGLTSMHHEGAQSTSPSRDHIT
jgi:hypothetical protein